MKYDVKTLWFILSGVAVLCVIALLFRNTAKDTEEISTQSVPGFKDCKMAKLKDSGVVIYIMRCPGSNTSVQWNTKGVTYFSNVIQF